MSPTFRHLNFIKKLTRQKVYCKVVLALLSYYFPLAAANVNHTACTLHLMVLLHQLKYGSTLIPNLSPTNTL